MFSGMSVLGKCRREAWRWAALVAASVGLGLVGSVVGAEPAAEPGSPLYFTNAEDRFSITLPPGWTQMPPIMAAGLSDQALATKGGGVGAYGFEPGSNTNSLKAPCVTVQVVRAGRMGDGYVRMLNHPEIRRRAVLDLVKKDGLDERNIVDVKFETNRCRLSFSATQTDERGDEFRLWHAMTFTERGTINVSCLADESDSRNWEELFGGVQDSLTVHSSVAYQPRSTGGNVEGAKFRASSVLLIPGIMVLVGLGRLVSRRFAGDVMSDEI